MTRKKPLQTEIPGFGCIFRPGYRDRHRVQKYGAIWWMRYTAKDGVPVRVPTGCKDQADAYAELLKKAGAVAGGQLTTSAPERVTVGQLLDLLLEDYKESGNRTFAGVSGKVEKHIRPEFGHRRALDIGTNDLKVFVRKLRTAGLAAASINRHLAALRRAFYLGHEHDPRLVLHVPKFPIQDESGNVRTGVFTHEMYVALRGALAPHAALALVIGYHTGMRLGEILAIRWEQVDFAAGVIRLEAAQVKNKTGRVAPIYGEMRGYLDMAKSLRDSSVKYKTCDRVIAHKGSGVTSLKTAWLNAVERLVTAGVEMVNPRFHDLRRTALTRMEDAGIPRSVAMAVSGHKTESVYKRYCIGSEKRTVAAGKVLEEFMQKDAAAQKAQEQVQVKM